MEWERNSRDSEMFGNSKKEENHEPNEDRATIDESVEFISRSL
jgi:hypothetical protein